ncbi:HPr kinase [Fibrisoma limi BUZ 3]|uniref:HPr kinase n=1 Tax=Fibrisoma limi BUZ 3 TaxID=1185876 RepID=I2GJE1_9BACT|nr:HPr kinase [Fibrisoma limi]CCH54016.1 HPr kinase [Fibrisoma limi BUZ 3]
MEVRLYFYKAYGLIISSEIPLPPLVSIEPTTADVFIRRGSIPVGPTLVSTKAYRAGLNARFAQEGTGRLLLEWAPIISFLAINGEELIVDTNYSDEDTVALFTLSEAIGLLLFQRGYFLLHGSAVQVNGKGVVFVGVPGAGKSTTVAAFAQKECKVISDDMVCIQINKQEKPSLIPAFSQIKVWENSVDGLQLPKERLTNVREGVNKFSWHNSAFFEEDIVPLAQVFVLMPSSDSNAAIEPVPMSQVPVELIGYFPLPDSLLNGLWLKEFFEKSVAVAQSVPTAKLSRPPNFSTLYEFVEHIKTMT